MPRFRASTIVKFLIVIGTATAVSVHSCRESREIYRAVDAQNRRPTEASAEAVRQAASFQVVEFDSLLSDDHGDSRAVTVDQILAVLGSCHRQIETGIDDACVNALLRTAADFVYFRFVLADHDRYVDWRLAEGYRFRDRVELYGRALVGEDYEILFGVSLPENAPLRATFVRFADHHRQNWGATHTPTGLAVDPESAVVLIREINPVVGAELVTLGSPERDAYWLEPRMGSHRNWFEDGRHDGFTRYRSGAVGLTLDYGDGLKRTILIGFSSPFGSCNWSLSGISRLKTESTGGLIDY